MTPAQIANDYQESFGFLQAKKNRQAQQLKLLSNLKRGDQYIASTLLLTLFNRILSSLYDDKIQIKFLPSQGITQDQINSYNILAQSDYLEMGKAKLDYDWCWDTLFYGRGYIETLRFDKKRKILQPHVINPLVMGYDPYFSNPQDWRYYWKWITKNKHEINALIKAGVITDIKDVDELPSGIDPYLWQYKIKVDQARDGVTPAVEPKEHDVYQILEYFGYNKDGKKSIYWTDKNFAKIIFEEVLNLGDGEEMVAPNGETIETGSRWPIVVKEAFRDPHSSIPFSVADLLEDKHRAKNVLLNLAYVAAKDQANPLYGYNPDKVKDVSQFLSRQINQHIPMEDQTAAWPLQKAPAMTADLVQFIRSLDNEAEQPVGAGRPMGPTHGSARGTATESAIDQQLNDLAQSLQSKVMQFGEQDFWSHWFHRYAKNASELGDKMANIVGVKGVTSQTINLKDFNTDYPPGVLIYSAKEAEYKELVMRRDLMQQLPVIAQTMDPEGLRNFYKHVYWPKFLQDPSLIDIMFPKTLDEIKAEAENEQLQKNQLPQVLDTDEHTTHIYTHMMVQPKTWAVWFHIAEHEDKLAEQKQQMQQQQQMQLAQQSTQGAQSSSTQPSGQPSQSASPMGGQTGAQKQNPMEAAAPLKQAIQPNK